MLLIGPYEKEGGFYTIPRIRLIEVVSCIGLCVLIFSGSFLYGVEPQDLRSHGLTRKYVSDTPCQNLSGRYVFYGEALPGAPSFFGLHSTGLSVDLMLDIALFPQERMQVTAVEIIQDRSLEVVFHGQQGVVSRKQAISPENHVGCQGGKYTIVRVREGVGEATTATTTITETLYPAADGSLVIQTKLLSKNRSFIFWWTSSEEYAARFRRLPLPEH